MEADDELPELLKRVRNRSTFLVFVRALERDRRAAAELERASPSSPYGPGARGWENGTIESFLESAVGWAEDVMPLRGARAAWFPAAPSWAAFARFLYMGKLYE